MVKRSWWKCANAAACKAPGECAGASASPAAAALPPLLMLREIPATSMAPLFFFCATCSLRMAPCECCHILIDAEQAIDGVLLCKRCGFLTVLDPTLRALVQIPAFNRSILKRTPIAIADVANLREQLLQCEAQVRSMQEKNRESERAEAVLERDESNTAASSPAIRKRKRTIREDSEPPSPVGASQPFSPPSSALDASALEAESKCLQHQLHQVRRQWEHFVGESTEQPSHRLHLQQSFSSTHLNVRVLRMHVGFIVVAPYWWLRFAFVLRCQILKIMHEKNIDVLELKELSRQIEQFLLHQSTLLKMKYDLLSAVQTCREIEQLESPVFQAQTTPNVTKLIMNSTKEQLNHLYKAFETLSRPYLSLIGCANKHLFALYNAAQRLQSMRRTSQKERETSHTLGERFSPTTADRSTMLSPFLADRSRSRRRYGVRNTGSSSNANTLSDLTGHDEVSRVQQTIEYGNRITEISKKVELWRALSSTIASTCVLSILELSSANDAPLS